MKNHLKMMAHTVKMNTMINKKNMKKIFSILLIAISAVAYSQNKISEKDAIKKEYIDFDKEVLFFKLHGMIEIGAHTFKNDSCKCPILFFANLEGVIIQDTCSKAKYTHRKCNIKNCKIIHLSQVIVPQPVEDIYDKWNLPFENNDPIWRPMPNIRGL